MQARNRRTRSPNREGASIPDDDNPAPSDLQSQLYTRMANLPDEVKVIELWPCRYDAPCKVRNCRARATTIARSVDAGGRPRRQYELCAVHTEQVSERERAKGRDIVTRG
jgi:hypothetical protein